MCIQKELQSHANICKKLCYPQVPGIQSQSEDPCWIMRMLGSFETSWDFCLGVVRDMARSWLVVVFTVVVC